MVCNVDLWLFGFGLIGVIFSLALIYPPLAKRLRGLTGLIDNIVTGLYRTGKNAVQRSFSCTTSCISASLAGCLNATGIILMSLIFGIPMFFVARIGLTDSASVLAGLIYGFLVAMLYFLRGQQK